MTTYHPGCYVDGARGRYATDLIVAFARNHGACIEHDTEVTGCEATCPQVGSEFAGCEFASDYEDEATDYMNDRHPLAGHYWGRNDNGDWGLWPCEDN